MKKILFNILAFSCFVIATGCNDTDIANSSKGEEGILQLVVQKNSAINPVNSEVEDSLFEVPNIEEFKIIINNSNGEQYASFSKFSEMPEETRLKSGSYTLVASYGDNAPIAFDAPYYSGSSPFTIDGMANTQMSVTSSIANVLMTVSYTEKFKTVFKDYSLEVMTPHSVNEEGKYEALRFVGDDERVGFIKEANIIYLALNVTKTANNKTFRYGVTPIENAKGGEYYNLLLDTDARGEATVSITFSDATQSKDIDVEISQDFLPKDVPTISATFDTTSPYTLRYGLFDNSPVVAVFKAEGTIKSIVMNIDSQYAVAEGLSAMIDFSNISEEDKLALDNIGIEWNADLIGGESGNVRFTKMLSTLKPSTGVAESTNIFSFTLTDSYNRVVAKDISIVIKPLNIIMNSVHDYNVWSNRATISSASILDLPIEEQLSLEFKYQLSEDAETWSDLAQSNVEDGVVVSGLKDNSTYYVRATAKGLYSDAVSFTTEEAMNLPNASFEEHYTESFNSGKLSVTYYPYANGEANPFWQTLNPMTTGDSKLEYYKSYPVAMVTSDASEGEYAIRIETVGWGPNASAPVGWFVNTPKPTYKTPGKFYIGDFVDNGDSHYGTTNMVQGKPFSSRPSSISFDYKFAAYTNFANLNSATMQVFASLENRDGDTVTILAKGKFEKTSKSSSSGDYATQIIDLLYENTTMKATHISLSFQTQKDRDLTIAEFKIIDSGENRDHWDKRTTGAWLIVDNIVLGY